MNTLNKILDWGKEDNPVNHRKSKSIDDMYYEIHKHRNENSGVTYIKGGEYENIKPYN